MLLMTELMKDVLNVLLGGAATSLAGIAWKLAKDLNAAFTKIRTHEQRLSALEAALGPKQDQPKPGESEK